MIELGPIPVVRPAFGTHLPTEAEILAAQKAASVAAGYTGSQCPFCAERKLKANEDGVVRCIPCRRRVR